MQVDIKKLGTGDMDQFKELILLFENVFELEGIHIPAPIYLRQLLEKESFFVFVALLEGKVVGGLISYALPQYYSQLPLVYIYDLAVKTECQRKGIGKKLISGITDYCRQIGIEEVFVQAEEEDEHAVRFYHSTGATAEKVVHFNYHLNANHQGKNWF